MIKAAFFDIDGTLLSFNTHKVPESTIKAIQILREKGIKVIIATGRSFRQVVGLEHIEFDGYITFNGNLCLDKNKNVFFKNHIPKEDIQALIAYQNKRKFPCVFMSENENTINYVDDTVIKVFNHLNLPVNDIKDMHEAAKNDVIQLNVFLNPEEDLELMQDVLVHCEASRWTSLFSDVNVRNTHKGSGVIKFAEHLGIDISETISFGDGGNDIQMLLTTGMSVAMGNAGENVKNSAKYTTTTVDDDGIWNALKHLNII